MRMLHSDRKLPHLRLKSESLMLRLMFAHKSESYRFPLIFISSNLKELEKSVFYLACLAAPIRISLKADSKFMM
jgi:hypothetical protein